jgi:phosphohistidine phosphatase
MKTLLIMRHAKSSWNNNQLSDHDRPLNGRGKEDAPAMGKLLRDEDVVPDLIITSTAKRALATAEAVALAADFAGELQKTRQFYHADPDDYIELLQTVADSFSCVMVVGHNPGMAEWVQELTGRPYHFTTANIAHIELPIASWADLSEDSSGKLCHLWRPGEID